MRPSKTSRTDTDGFVQHVHVGNVAFHFRQPPAFIARAVLIAREGVGVWSRPNGIATRIHSGIKAFINDINIFDQLCLIIGRMVSASLSLRIPCCPQCGAHGTIRLQQTVRGESIVLDWSCSRCETEWSVERGEPEFVERRVGPVDRRVSPRGDRRRERAIDQAS